MFAVEGDKDPTKRETWDTEPTYSSHYSSDAERPNMCKVAHKVPAPLGKQQYNFTEGANDYIPYIGTSLVRDSQLMLMRLYYRCVRGWLMLGQASSWAGRLGVSWCCGRGCCDVQVQLEEAAANWEALCLRTPLQTHSSVD